MQGTVEANIDKQRIEVADWFRVHAGLQPSLDFLRTGGLWVKGKECLYRVRGMWGPGSVTAYKRISCLAQLRGFKGMDNLETSRGCWDSFGLPWLRIAAIHFCVFPRADNLAVDACAIILYANIKHREGYFLEAATARRLLEVPCAALLEGLP